MGTRRFGWVLGIALAWGLTSAAGPASARDCAGSQQVVGEGTSVVEQAHSNATFGWIANAGCVVGVQDPLFSPLFTPGDDLVYYRPLGTGSGFRAFGAGEQAGLRAPAIRFIAFDQAPNTAERALMEEGLYPVSVNPDGDDGILHTVPVAQAALAVIVNVPDACRPASFSQFRPVYPHGGPGTTNSTIEEVFSAEQTTWATLGYVLKSDISLPCDVAVRRVVRRDNSGATFVFKRFLNATDRDNDTAWEANDQTSEDNTIWLGQGRDRDGVCDGSDAGMPLTAPYVCTGLTNGGRPLANVVFATEGSIGYVDLAAARGAGFDYTGNTASSDDTYWLKLYQPSANPLLRDPAKDQANGWKSTATPAQKGANCSIYTNYNNVPSNTKSDWSSVIQAQTGPVYPLCAMSYMGAWEDMEDVYPAVPYAQLQAEQAQLAGYIQYILGNGSVGVGNDEGQTILPLNDYAALPLTPLARAAAYLTTYEGFDKAPDRTPVRP